MSFESFSTRILKHPGVATFPAIAPMAAPNLATPYVTAMNNQLLVATSVSSMLKEALTKVDLVGPDNQPQTYNVRATYLTSLLDGIDLNRLTYPKGLDDVEIWEVDVPDGSDIFAVADGVRNQIPGDPRRISPNHVLIPANEGFGCPHGPPSLPPEGTTFTLPSPRTSSPPPRITLIDSGYIWDPAWGVPPVTAAGGPAEQLPTVAEATGAAGPHWQPGSSESESFVNGQDWVTAPDGSQRLPALAGHANFSLSLLFKGCPEATFTLHAHNGSFVDASVNELPTEVTVARSLCQAAASGADVVSLGFAFPAYNGDPAWVWNTACSLFGYGGTFQKPTIDKQRATVIVVPAGNQNSPNPRFPAALAYTFKTGPFKNVIGVGSTKPADGPTQAWAGPYSNNGPWVTCSADGTDVISNFPHVNAALEDAETAVPVDFTAGVAQWTGTSFSTPKVAARIASSLAGSDHVPLDAWTLVRALAGSADDPHHKLGRRLPF